MQTFVRDKIDADGDNSYGMQNIIEIVSDHFCEGCYFGDPPVNGEEVGDSYEFLLETHIQP